MKISFCIATYNRPERLARVLEAISSQEDTSDLEIVISDNDPGGSGGEVALRPDFAHLQINYAVNEVNLGMVGNFNRSLARASGEFIIFNTDDDPPMPSLVGTLRRLREDHPGYGAYFGAAGTFLEETSDAEVLRSKIGLRPLLAARPEGSVTKYTNRQFLEGFFTSGILPYFLWSTGMVRVDIARKAGGMPDYGSPYFTDFCYLAVTGAAEGMVVKNTLLGYQIIHAGNFGKGANKSLSTGLKAAHAFLKSHLPSSLVDTALQQKIDSFFGWWAVSQLVWMRKLGKTDPDLNAEISVVVKEFRSIPFFRPLYGRYLARAYFPFIGRNLQRIRKFLTPTPG